MRFATLEEALHYARAKESQSYHLYRMFEKIVRDPAAAKILSELARQEHGHMKLIDDALERGTVATIGGRSDLTDVSFSDYMPAAEIDERSDVQDVMRHAMKMERMAADLYRQLQHHYEGTALESLFRRLAEEELNHKRILEDQYETHFLQWM